MGLNDLVEDTTIKRFTDSDDGPEPEHQYHTTRADFTKEEKPCPHCMCVSQRKEDSEIWYKCPNPECGTILFMAGWNECRPDFYFLGEVEITGWRYNG